jgi:xanthine dehydrogenase YagS FAD-binding subunit
VKAFTYTRPEHVADAVRLAAQESARYLGGGTNLVDLMKLGVERPEHVVDISRLPFAQIEVRGDGAVQVGANVSNAELGAHREVRRRFPALSQALLAGASGQLRNAATVGGNLLQRTRCLYFQDVTKPCNKREPGSGCPARDGEHHNLAILGASEHCIATHPSDMAVALAAFDAVIHVQTADGPREVAIADLYVAPGDDPRQETTLPPGALITAVVVPPLSFAATSRYRKVRERASYAFANASVAAAVDVADGTVRDVRLAFGAVAPMPWRARIAEDELRGRPLQTDTARAALAAELAAARPLRDNAYKLDLITSIGVYTLLQAAGVADDPR